ncbi:MAG: hypothetical protein ACFFCS_28355 [Candidatus Hodarchaeota archaeon]
MELDKQKFTREMNDVLTFRRRIDIDTLIKIIEEAEIMSNSDLKSTLLRFLLQSHTHHSNYEYPQSFVMSWGIIEQYIGHLLATQIIARGLGNSEARRLERQFIDTKIRFLDLFGMVGNDIYNGIMRLKLVRNKVVHDLYTISEEEAEECYNLAKLCFKRLIAT